MQISICMNPDTSKRESYVRVRHVSNNATCTTLSRHTLKRSKTALDLDNLKNCVSEPCRLNKKILRLRVSGPLKPCIAQDTVKKKNLIT